MFSLGALRDPDDEFSSRSQFWGRLLKAIEVPTALESRVQRVLDLLNQKLLQADPRLAEIANIYPALLGLLRETVKEVSICASCL